MADPGQDTKAPRTTRATPRPSDAASLLVIDRSEGPPRILLGRRHPGQAFVPDKYVFPGGRLEAADQKIETIDDLDGRDVERLMHDMKGRATTKRARGLALAAIRETFEETGVVIGTTSAPRPDASKLADNWQRFIATGVMPTLNGLRFIARAITPPGRTRRYDTRFFLVDATQIGTSVAASDGEFTEITWVTFDEARLLDLHVMTRTVLDDTAEFLALAPDAARDAAIPYYYSRNGRFRRELIPPPSSA